MFRSSESVQRQKAMASALLAEERARSAAQAREEAEVISTFLTQAFQSPDPARKGEREASVTPSVRLGTERAEPAPADCAACLPRERTAGQPKDQCRVWAPVPLTRVAAERPVVRLVGTALAVVADLAQVMPYLPQSGDWVPVV